MVRHKSVGLHREDLFLRLREEVLLRLAAMRALSFERPASSGAIARSSSTSFNDSSKRPVFAKDFTARSSIAKRWTVPGSSATRARWRQALMPCSPSVPRHLGLDAFGPLVDPAHEVLHLSEAEIAEEVRDPTGPDARLAVHDDLVRRAEFVDPRRYLHDGHEDRLVEMGDLPLHRLADVEEDDLLPAVDLRFQVVDGDLVLLADLFGRRAKPAELLVVDELLDRRVRAADRAGRILPEPKFAELHPERVEDEETANQR